MSTARVVGTVLVVGGMLAFVQGLAVLLVLPEPVRVPLVLVVGLAGALYLLLAGRARTVRTVGDRAGDEPGGGEQSPQVRGSRPEHGRPHGW